MCVCVFFFNVWNIDLFVLNVFLKLIIIFIYIKLLKRSSCLALVPFTINWNNQIYSGNTINGQVEKTFKICVIWNLNLEVEKIYSSILNYILSLYVLGFFSAFFMFLYCKNDVKGLLKSARMCVCMGMCVGTAIVA